MRSSASLWRPVRSPWRRPIGRSFAVPAARATPSSAACPLDWSETKNVVWKTKVPGLGWSSPVVAGGRWSGSTSATGDRDVSLRALAFDVETGREVVNVEVFRLSRPRDINPKNSFASPTPVIEGDRVYVHFGADGTAALTRTGEIVWKTTLPYASQHGAGGSPVVYDDLLIFSCDGHDAAFVVALDKRTGKVRWKTNRRQPADQAYTTPLVIRVGDRDQTRQRRRLSCGGLRSGDRARRSGASSYADGFSNVPRPVFGHGLVYIATGLSAAGAHCRASGWDRRRDENPHRVDAGARRAADAVAAPRRRRAVHRQRRRHRVVRRRDDRRDALADAAWWDILRLAGLRRRPHLFSRRARRASR